MVVSTAGGPGLPSLGSTGGAGDFRGEFGYTGEAFEVASQSLLDFPPANFFISFHAGWRNIKFESLVLFNFQDYRLIIMPRTMDEREKLRKFRELDDAFAQALRDLDGGPRAAASAPEPRPATPAFEERLRGLMKEYALSQGCVHEMLSTLVEYKEIS